MLRAGAAQVDITPQPGVWLTGYGTRTEPSTGVHDPLFARALYLESAGRRAALVAADIIGFDEDLVGRIRDRVKTRTDIHPSHLMLAATHTHAGPSVKCLERMAPADASFLERAVEGIAEAVAAAERDAVEASIGAGFATGSIGVNRRQRAADGSMVLGEHPAGPVDRRVGVLRVDGGGGPICVMLNHGCHGVVLCDDNLLISADWPGAAVRAMAQAVRSAVVMVTNGACGDINPAERGSFEAVERQGAAVARAGLSMFDNITLSSRVEIEAATRPIRLPTRAPTREEAQAQLASYRAALAGARESGDAAAIRAHEAMCGWAQDMSDHAASGAPPEPVTSEIQAIAMDDIALVGLPGEVFVEIGDSIAAASPFRHTFIIGYANRIVGYIPTQKAFAEGGYEVDSAHRWYGFLAFTPEVQGIVERTAVELLKSLR
ncbi:MAG: neutral/alkaline non-lysosomal ceramidase N-terminal domain-containing protein [Armatimonadota bacterium]|nr:MAG: neutral/alkaline non-lysosomal ceramidase N-terminal domain-containing protein [Armatimonadota bacterium]